MGRVSSLNDFKECVQAVLDNNEESMARFGKTISNQLKCYLLESNCGSVSDIGCPVGKWKSLDSSGWFVNVDDANPSFSETIFMNASRKRVLKLYSLLDAATSDIRVDDWIKRRSGLDYCWLTREMLYHWKDQEGWEERGLGLKFNDGLAIPDEAGNFSLKAWHGANRYLGPELDDVLNIAKEKFAINSIRWQKRAEGGVKLSAEWYSNGKVTFNRAEDVDEVLSTVTEMAIRYEDEIGEATKLRDSKMAAFEIEFGREINLDRFTEIVSKGMGDMRLWLVETQSGKDFRRFQGVDMHTWDRVLLDVGFDYAFLTIPRKGCVNAAPRLATIQGEDNAGKTKIYFDGVGIFG